MEENKKFETYKYTLCFDIDVPRNLEESIFNSIIIGINQFKYMKDDGETTYRIRNNLLMKIQEELDQLMIPEED